MGQILHGSARTTAAVRRAIQHSQESLIALSKRHGINPKTVAKWKRRTSVTDHPTGPKDAHSTMLQRYGAAAQQVVASHLANTFTPVAFLAVPDSSLLSPTFRTYGHNDRPTKSCHPFIV